MFKYLRVSVTDRCNFRCVYCMPETGIDQLSHQNVMRYEEILSTIKAAVDTGVEQIRITGGEPLVRKGIVDFIAKVASISGVKDLAMTTNASLLADCALQLKQAGLRRVNISMDSLNPQLFKKITRTGNLQQVLNGIDAAIKAGLEQVKINLVLIPGLNEHEIMDFVDFAYQRQLNLRFIERMPFNTDDPSQALFVPQEKVINQISKKYKLSNITSDSYGPARSFQINDTKAKVGFISSRTAPFCHECKRLRLTANGYLLPCLDSDSGVYVKDKTEKQIVDIIKKLYKEKMSWHKQHACYGITYSSYLSKIGG